MSGEADVQPGSRVCMHFSLALTDGSEAVSTFGEQPLEFTMGDGTLTEELELALYGLKAGARQRIIVDGGKAYGRRDPANIHRIPLERFPPQVQPQAGLIVGFHAADGTEIPGAVVELDDTGALVDFNHPLAGREVVFTTEILSVNPPE